MDPIIFANARAALSAPQIDIAAVDAMQWTDTSDGGIRSALIRAQDIRKRVQDVRLIRSDEASILTATGAPAGSYTLILPLSGGITIGDVTHPALTPILLPPGFSPEWIMEDRTIALAVSPGCANRESDSPAGRYDLRPFFGLVCLSPNASVQSGEIEGVYARLKERNCLGLVTATARKSWRSQYVVGGGGACALILGGGAGFNNRTEQFEPGDLFVAAPLTKVDFTGNRECAQLGVMFEKPTES